MSPGEMNSKPTEKETIDSFQEEYDRLFNKLRTQRKQFVSFYLVSLDVTKAAVQAGYSKHTAMVQGSRLLRSNTISQLVTLSQRLLSLRSRLSQDWVMSELKKQYEVCVKEDKHQAATRNLELIGQQLGMFGKGKEKEGGDLHLHQHKYVEYPQVPESIAEWVKQMKEIGFQAALPEHSDEASEQTKGEDNEQVNTEQDS